MTGPAAVAEVALQRARQYGSPTRVYLEPDGHATLINGSQWTRRILWSQLIGVYNKHCPPGWIEEDVRAAIEEKKHMCPSCGQQLPR